MKTRPNGSMLNFGKGIAFCCLAVLISLYVVGAVSHGSLRHEVQTLPLWVPIVLGFRQRETAKWCALPGFAFWFIIMVFIWLFLLGWAHIVSGHFSTVEIVMTLIIGAACVIGLVKVVRWRTAVRPLVASGTVVVFAVFQLMAFRISLLPGIGDR